MGAYQCKKCGMVSGSKSGVCDANSKVGPYFICDECSKHSVTSEDLCKPLKMHPKYYCNKCGTTGVKQNSLCKPKRIFV